MISEADRQQRRQRLRKAREALDKALANRDRAIHAADAAGLSQRDIAREVGLSDVQVGRIIDRDASMPRDRRATWIAHALTFVRKRSRSEDDLTQSIFRMGLQNVLAARLAGNPDPELAELRTMRDVVAFASRGLDHAPDYDAALLDLEWPLSGAS